MILKYQNIIPHLTFITCLIIVYFLSLKKYNNIITKTKVILFYNSNKQLCLNIIDSVWKNIINKYNHIKHIEFETIDINHNKKYSHISFNELPQIYIINQDANILYKYNNNININDLNKFIVESMAFV